MKLAQISVDWSLTTTAVATTRQTVPRQTSARTVNATATGSHIKFHTKTKINRSLCIFIRRQHLRSCSQIQIQIQNISTPES